MRLIIYSFIGLLVATTYYIPSLQGIFAEHPDFDAYRMIAINVALARLLIEGIVGRVRWKRSEAQLQASLQTEKEMATRRIEEQREGNKKADALAQQLRTSKNLADELANEILRVEDENKKLRVGFDDLMLKHRELEMMPQNQSDATIGDEAINLLSLLQQNGRFVDFVMEDITSVPDQQIGAVARIVHQGCGQVLKDLFNIKPINDQGEGHKIVIASDADMSDIRLVGRVGDEPPYEGILLHRGWQTDRIDLPKNSGQRKISGPRLIAPAEVELH